MGGHFAFLALERACGGRAVEALRFLDDQDEGPEMINAQEALAAEMALGGRGMMEDEGGDGSIPAPAAGSWAESDL